MLILCEQVIVVGLSIDTKQGDIGIFGYSDILRFRPLVSDQHTGNKGWTSLSGTL